MFHRTLLLCALTTAFSLPVQAQTTTMGSETETNAYDQSNLNSDIWGPIGGEWELILSGSGSNDEDFENGGFNVSADLGYYVSDTLSVGVRQTGGYSNPTTGGTDWTGSSGVFSQLHCGEDSFRPFVGAGLGFLYGDGVNDTLAAGPEAGFRYYVKDDTFVYLRAQYEFLFESGNDISDNFDDGRFSYTLGVGFQF